MTKDQQALIGITTYGRNTNGDFTLPTLYVDSVRRAGGIPVLIPPGEEQLEVIISRLDGIILTGGGDLEPCAYNGKSHEKNYNIDPERDATELDIGRLILKSKIPTFAICRGIQIINTILKGSLFGHIPDKHGEKVLHRLPPRKTSVHDVTIEKDSLLFQILGKSSIDVVSWHHQSIDDLGEGLRISAKSSDNIVEAIEFAGEPWFLGVQWHPELSAANDVNQQNLFRAFVDYAKKQQLSS